MKYLHIINLLVFTPQYCSWIFETGANKILKKSVYQKSAHYFYLQRQHKI